VHQVGKKEYHYGCCVFCCSCCWYCYLFSCYSCLL